MESFADVLVLLLLQFHKTPLDIAVDIGRHDLFQLMQQLSVCSTSHISSKHLTWQMNTSIVHHVLSAVVVIALCVSACVCVTWIESTVLSWLDCDWLSCITFVFLVSSLTKTSFEVLCTTDSHNVHSSAKSDQLFTGVMQIHSDWCLYVGC